MIRAIANAALNAREGDVTLKPHEKNIFRKHRQHIDTLIDRQVPLDRKRELLLQRGGALPVVVPLITSVLALLGSEFISRLIRGDNEH